MSNTNLYIVQEWMKGKGIPFEYSEEGINPQIKVLTPVGFWSVVCPFDYHDDTLEVAFVRERGKTNNMDNVRLYVEHADGYRVIDFFRELM